VFALNTILIFGVIVLIFWNGAILIQFLTLLYYKFRIPIYTSIDRKEIGKEIESVIKPLEDFLLSKGFVYQSMLLHNGWLLGGDQNYYALYYYDKEKSIHAYIETQPYRGALQSAKISYETIYESKRECITVDGLDYGYPAIPDDTYLFDHYFGNDEKVYEAHLKDRDIEGEVLSKRVFAPEELRHHKEAIDALYSKTYEKEGYTHSTSYGYRFTPSIKLWIFSKKMVKKYKQYSKVLAQSRHEEDCNRKEEENQKSKSEINSLLMQLSSIDKPRGEGNKKVWFVGSMIVFAILFGFLGFSLLEIGMLVVVLLIHELGHFLAMRYFGYTDTSIFFMPFGAATIGRKSKKSAFEEYVILLAGPLPGIIISAILFMAMMMNVLPQENEIISQYVMFSFIINYLNLLPIYPLDGGRITQVLLLLRYPRAQFYFYLVSLVVIVLAALLLQDFILLIFVVIVGLALRHNYYISKIMHKILTTNHNNEITKEDIAEMLVNDKSFKTQLPFNKAHIVKQVIEILHTKKPNIFLAIFGFAFYCVLVFIPLWFAFLLKIVSGVPVG
jgi:Zn-dependent protease